MANRRMFSLDVVNTDKFMEIIDYERLEQREKGGY